MPLKIKSNEKKLTVKISAQGGGYTMDSSPDGQQEAINRLCKFARIDASAVEKFEADEATQKMMFTLRNKKDFKKMTRGAKKMMKFTNSFEKGL